MQAFGHCIGGLSLFMAIGGGHGGRALGDVLQPRRPPDPDAGQPARAWARMATILKRSAIKRLDIDTTRALGRQG